MKAHYLQHVPFEDPANILRWADTHGIELSKTSFFSDERLPEVNQFDWLIVMGGPMNIYEENVYPWLAAEKEFIAEAVKSKKVVLGICLGAQLLADVLGGRVYRNDHKEIGWHPVNLTLEGKYSPLFNGVPERFTAFHWHGDTFHLPPGATRLASSPGCAHQAFEYGAGRVLGLQFHLESSLESIRQLIHHCGDELVEGEYIQSAEEILSRQQDIKMIQNTMDLVLTNMLHEFGGG
jgi:GMP synthase-like glutamine amidotransferase